MEDKKFDYTVLKTGNIYDEKEYKRYYKKIERIYKKYEEKLTKIHQNAQNNHLIINDETEEKGGLDFCFEAQCHEYCEDDNMLCDILLDICYSKETVSKAFVWSVCGDMIIHNLLIKNNSNISYPVPDKDGDIEYGGERFKMVTVKINTEEVFSNDIDE